MKHRMYIDEVGNSDLESSDNPNHRFLSLTGVILELGYVQKTLHPQMEQLKTKYFHSHPDDPVILHRKEMINARSPFETLKDEAVRQAFDEDLSALMASWEYTAITVCLDKNKHKETSLPGRSLRSCRRSTIARGRGYSARRCYRRTKKALAGPMALAIHLRLPGLHVLSTRFR